MKLLNTAKKITTAAALAVLHPVRFCPAAGGVRFSTLPGSALGVGLELSEL